MKNKLSKLYKIFLAVGMVFSMCFNTLGMSVVNAYDPSVPKEFTRVKNIKYPEWWGRKIPSIASWSTYSCKYDGKWAFCLEAEKVSSFLLPNRKPIYHRIYMNTLTMKQWMESFCHTILDT